MHLSDEEMQHGLRGVAWINKIRGLRTSDVGVTPVRGHSAMMPVGDGDGALLIWVFDSKPGSIPFLFVRLTEEEANAVYAADPYTVGMLEPVRRHITTPWAVLAVERDGAVDVTPYRINKHSSEGDFIAELDAATAALLAGGGQSEVPNAETFTELARELACA